MEGFLEFISLSDPNVRLAVPGMILLAISAGITGTFAFLRKKALVGDAIAHSVLPGVCLAFILSGTKNPLYLLLGATLTGWLSISAIDFISAKSRIKPDAAIGLTLSVFFGVGVLLLTAIQQSGNASQSGLHHYLLGQAAAITTADLQLFAIVAAIISLTTLLFFKQFTLLSFDHSHAQAMGLLVRFLEAIMAILVVLAVATGIQAVGIVLMAAMLITPAAAARYWTDKLGFMILIAIFIGAISGIGGAYVSYTYSNMPTGPWTIVFLTLIAVFSLLAAPKRGVLASKIKSAANRRKIADENILKAFYQLGERDGNFLKARTQTELLAKRRFKKDVLKKSIGRLHKKGLLRQSNAGDFQLSPDGAKAGRRLVRIHRLWEVYLTKYLRLPPDHIHDTAEAMEHVITPDLEKTLEKLLDYPERDPHNSNIPYGNEQFFDPSGHSDIPAEWD